MKSCLIIHKNMARDKTAHPPLNKLICPLPEQLARTRLPRGTQSYPLNAARFPAWHGSRASVAQDQVFNTTCLGQTTHQLSWGGNSSLL